MKITKDASGVVLEFKSADDLRPFLDIIQHAALMQKFAAPAGLLMHRLERALNNHKFRWPEFVVMDYAFQIKDLSDLCGAVWATAAFDSDLEDDCERLVMLLPYLMDPGPYSAQFLFAINKAPE